MIKWNFDKVVKALDASARGAEIEFTKQLQYVAEKTLEKLSKNSPQWSGNFAANWVLGVNSYGYDYDDTMKGEYDPKKYSPGEMQYLRGRQAAMSALSGKPEPLFDKGDTKFRGDMEAVRRCLQNNAAAIASIKSPRSRLFFTNQTPYGKNIETNTREDGKSPYLRVGNWLPPHPIPLGSVMAELGGSGLGMLAREGRRSMRSKE